MSEHVRPYGTWPSPVTAAAVAEGRGGVGELTIDGGTIWWLESRPTERGRSVLMRRTAFSEPVEVLPDRWNVRTTVHEYGGGAYWRCAGSIVFANFDDQRLWRIDDGATEPVPITPDTGGRHRYADGRAIPGGAGATCVAVRERHADGAVHNELVLLAADGSRPPSTIADGADFFAAPRPGPDGRRLAWIRWDAPQMPWDGTELWVGELTGEGELRGARRVAGGATESLLQPAWSPDGRLHVISDRSGWWNLYRVDDGDLVPLAPIDAECAFPPWEFGYANYAVLDDGRIALAYERDTVGHLALLDPGTGEMLDLDLPFTVFVPPDVHAEGTTIAVVGAGPTHAPSVATIDLDARSVEVLRESEAGLLEAPWISVPEPVAFPSEDGRTAYALYHPPVHPDVRGPEGERPPLIVMSHGGPTDHAVGAYDLRTQFWTTRGFAVVDVNYGGSSGYGRAYRELLRGRWGVVDVEDCIAAARFLVDRGDVDPARIAIRGGSAGGYTTLCALTFHDGIFAAGASYYGVADAEALARDTHKFEARYLDGLIGPYPERADRYRERSPIHATDRLRTPLLVLQGDEDAVVPLAQAEVLVDALRARGLPYAYLVFRGEQHGFRRAEHIRRALEAELSFYAQIMGFEPDGDIEPITIENLQR